MPSRALVQSPSPPTPSPSSSSSLDSSALPPVDAIPLATFNPKPAMAPDRGVSSTDAATAGETPTVAPDHVYRDDDDGDDGIDDEDPAQKRARARALLAARAAEPQNFTLRGILVGLAIGIVICFSNTYFGLQTGWVSSMAMPSALLGFAWFRLMSRYLRLPFSPVENVLIQSVAGSVGTMPLGCGFVGVIPAMQYLLKPEENGPLDVGLWKLIVWAVGICFFGVVFAVPLRRQVIIREKLKFPSGTAAALMIGVLHGEVSKDDALRQDKDAQPQARGGDDDETVHLLVGGAPGGAAADAPSTQADEVDEAGTGLDGQSDWKAKIRLLTVAFLVSAIYVRASPVFVTLR